MTGAGSRTVVSVQTEIERMDATAAVKSDALTTSDTPKLGQRESGGRANHLAPS
jgi:hypothetical protein